MRARRLKNEINVVPYIDVMLVLLVIFMVTAPMMQTSTINLPNVDNSNIEQDPIKPLEIEVTADHLKVTDRNSKDSGTEIDRSELRQAILDAQARNPEQPILIAGDRDVKYDLVLNVMDEAKRAGAKRVGLLVQTGGK
jgi:biopolymer transport protein TolR